MAAARFVTSASKIVAVGRNFTEHAKELGNAVPTSPVLFLKPPSSFVRQPGSIWLPKNVVMHHEVELGVIINKQAREVSEQSAMDFVGGYTLALDMTARNLQEEAKNKGLPWTVAKGFDTFCAVGDFIPKSKILDPHDVELWLKVDDQLKQKGSTKLMIFSIPKLISHISNIMTLEAGDLILTGTPSGVGEVKDGQVMTAGLVVNGAQLSSIRFPVSSQREPLRPQQQPEKKQTPKASKASTKKSSTAAKL